jgi:hypothetical protein
MAVFLCFGVSSAGQQEIWGTIGEQLVLARPKMVDPFLATCETPAEPNIAVSKTATRGSTPRFPAQGKPRQDGAFLHSKAVFGPQRSWRQFRIDPPDSAPIAAVRSLAGHLSRGSARLFLRSGQGARAASSRGGPDQTSRGRRPTGAVAPAGFEFPHRAPNSDRIPPAYPPVSRSTVDWLPSRSAASAPTTAGCGPGGRGFKSRRSPSRYGPNLGRFCQFSLVHGRRLGSNWGPIYFRVLDISPLN